MRKLDRYIEFVNEIIYIYISDGISNVSFCYQSWFAIFINIYLYSIINIKEN